jgi:hypothetical protein
MDTIFSINEAYRDDSDLRNKFFQFIQAVFPHADFKAWYDAGYWSDHYIPHSIIKKDVIASNVSISKMKLLIDRKVMNGIQIGTVGTIPEYRNQGMSRFLMEYVIEKYQLINDIMFLFANESVLDFYPKFDFKQYPEVLFISTSIPESNYNAKKLNLQNKADVELIHNFLSFRQDVTRIFSALDYEFITQWHLINIFSDNLHYLNDEEIIFVISKEKKELHIWDIICKHPFDIETVLSKIIQSQDTESIIYHFPPDQLGYKYDEITTDNDSFLFVRGNFDLKTKHFKFPVTAQT